MSARPLVTPGGARRRRATDRAPEALALAAREERDRERSGERAPWRALLWRFLDQFKEDLAFIAAASIAAFLRAMGVTVESGWTGLLFRFGRARRELEPGFHFLIPFVNTAKRIPTRSRTMDLPAQRVTTYEGLVYLVDANLVYRVVDVRRALIEVDDYERGMRQVLGLAVQEVIRAAERDALGARGSLDEELRGALAQRLERWGIGVESAGFPSIRPSPRTLRITQLVETVGERRRQLAALAAEGRGELGLGSGLGLVGTRRMPTQRMRAMQRFVRVHRRVLRVHRRLQAQGWNGAEIARAERRVLDHIAAQLRPGVFVR